MSTRNYVKTITRRRHYPPLCSCNEIAIVIDAVIFDDLVRGVFFVTVNFMDLPERKKVGYFLFFLRVNVC